MKLGLITRCKDEYFIEEFVLYYLSQGVDAIYVIDDDSQDKSIYDNILTIEGVFILFKKNIIKENYAEHLYKAIRLDFEWMIYIDVDEFIRPHVSLDKTIKQFLIDYSVTFDCVKIPWVMMSSNGIEKSPSSIIETNVYRWNHDLRHENMLSKHEKFRCRFDQIEVKCIFKPSKFRSLFDHHPLQPINKDVKVVDGISLNTAHLNSYHENLREKDIKNGKLLCYHYRIISTENSVNKLKNNIWYIENGYTVDDLMSSDYPEVIDTSIKDERRKNASNAVLNKKTNFFGPQSIKIKYIEFYVAARIFLIKSLSFLKIKS